MGTDVTCPPGDACSPIDVDVELFGTPMFDQIVTAPLPTTAQHGQQTMRLLYRTDAGELVPLDFSFHIYDDFSHRVDNATEVTFTGLFEEGDFFGVFDDEDRVIDYATLPVRPLSRIELAPAEVEVIPRGRRVVFASGPHDFGIQLFGRAETSSGPLDIRLVDVALKVSLTGAQQLTWDTFRFNATVGSLPIGLVVAQESETVELVAVATADIVAAIGPAPTSIAKDAVTLVCFEATNASRYVAGLPWTFIVDGVATTQGDGTPNRNCARVLTNKVVGDSVAVEAQAGGQSMTLMLAVQTLQQI